MSSLELTPLRKEPRGADADACFGADGAHKNAALFGDTKVLQSSPGERPRTVFNDVFILLIYIIYMYIFQLYFVFVTVVPVHDRSQGQPTVALVHYGRERRAVGGSAHRSAHQDKRAHRSARLVAVALNGAPR